MKLFDLEQKILNDIAETFPFSFSECTAVYQLCCSFDKTIKILDFCEQHQVDPSFADEVIKIIKDW